MLICIRNVRCDELLSLSDDGNYSLRYYSYFRPGFRRFKMPEGYEYDVDVIDTWNMTIEHRGTFSGNFKIDMPGREYMAIRMIRRKTEKV